MRILVTGAGGMLSQTLVPTLEQRGHSVRALTQEQMDITNYMQVMDIFAQVRPELVIHGAAYTKVDLAETESDQAYLVNGYGTENIAVACNTINAAMLYISTDYVFDGTARTPYQPWAETNPVSVYGQSKLAGELAVKQHLSRFYIVRTSWLYGPGGANFVETMLRLASERKVLEVVQDQQGTPTSTVTLSDVIADLIATDRWGIYHATDGGDTTWYDFAREILKGKDVEVRPTTTAAFPRPATRPAYSILDKTSLVKTIGRDLVPWQEALANYLNLRLQKQPA
jgi:dTDP-4-dehydrorhamnose reductase